MFEHVEGGCLFIIPPFPFLSASFSDLSFSPHFSLGSGQPIKFVQWCEEDDVKLLSDESVKGLIAAQHQEHGWCKASDEGVISQGSSQRGSRSDNIRFFQV